MRAYAPEATEIVPTAKRPAERHVSTARPQSDQSAPAPANTMLQRKAACACGGGCPVCTNAAARFNQPDDDSATRGTLHETARAGVQGTGAQLPHLDRIQAAFGSYDVTAVRAHLGREPAQAAQAIGASAYTVGERVAFDGQPDLFTAAHEAAHVVQQRAGVQLSGGVGAAGDRYEQHADAVAARVVSGHSAEGLLGQMAGGTDSAASAAQPAAAVQREESKAAKEKEAKHAAMAADAVAAINAGLAKVGDDLVKDSKDIKLVILNEEKFARAWQDYVDRSGTSGASTGGTLNGFVDPTHPNGKVGFVRERSDLDLGTLIHEAMHQRAHADFYPGKKAGPNVNEGTTELFTRVVIGYAGGKIERKVYEAQKNAMLRLQGICGLSALAKWYFKGDITGVEKSLGTRLTQFLYWMDSPDLGATDAASRAESAINAL